MILGSTFVIEEWNDLSAMSEDCVNFGDFFSFMLCLFSLCGYGLILQILVSLIH